MGFGSYDVDTARTRSVAMGYADRSVNDIFSRELNEELNPKGVILRESRDSEEHPNSIPVIIGLDVTGSMGHIPHHMIKDGLNRMMELVLGKGLQDVQIMLTAVGDHECDDAPLQITQFESNDEILDKWLKKFWIERGGGGNGGESYMLPWYFGMKHTVIDSFERRNKKGFIFTIGDEPVLPNIPKSALNSFLGSGEKDYTTRELLEEASKMYHIYHIHVREGSNGRKQKVVDGWTDLLGENLIIAEDHRRIPELIAEKILQVSTDVGIDIDSMPTEPERNIIVTDDSEHDA